MRLIKVSEEQKFPYSGWLRVSLGSILEIQQLASGPTVITVDYPAKIILANCIEDRDSK